MPTITEKITDIVGYERMVLICEVAGGECWYIPKSAPIELRNRRIKQEFENVVYGRDGNLMKVYSALGNKYGLSARHIKRICNFEKK